MVVAPLPSCPEVFAPQAVELVPVVIPGVPVPLRIPAVVSTMPGEPTMPRLVMSPARVLFQPVAVCAVVVFVFQPVAAAVPVGADKAAGPAAPTDSLGKALAAPAQALPVRPEGPERPKGPEKVSSGVSPASAAVARKTTTTA